MSEFKTTRSARELLNEDRADKSDDNRRKMISEDRLTVTPPINSQRPNPFLPEEPEQEAQPERDTQRPEAPGEGAESQQEPGSSGSSAEAS